jgi:hypothetical protein
LPHAPHAYSRCRATPSAEIGAIDPKSIYQSAWSDAYFDGIVGEVYGPEVFEAVKRGHVGDLVAMKRYFGEVAKLGEDCEHGG